MTTGFSCDSSIGCGGGNVKRGSPELGEPRLAALVSDNNRYGMDWPFQVSVGGVAPVRW